MSSDESDSPKNRRTLPTKKPRGHFVQTDRMAHELWAKLGVKYPAASALLHVLAANVGERNAVVASHKVLSQLMGASVSTIKRALQILEAGNWIEIHQIGQNGTVNAYVLNHRVAWTEARGRMRYARIQADVILAEDEQRQTIEPENQPPLHALPRKGEIQIPYGDGLDPPSQPFFDGMEPDLPSTENPRDD